MQSANRCLTTALFCMGLAAAASGEEPADRRFVRLEPEAAAQILETGADQMRAIFDGVRTWEGEILVVDRFTFRETPPAPQDAPNEEPAAPAAPASSGSTATGEGTPENVKDVVEGERRARARFWYDRENSALFSESENVEPTTLRNRRTQRISTSHDRQRVKVIVRPDGMDTLWPDELAGDFVGFPRSVTADQPLSRYVNREAPESASQVRMYSFLIDPTITLETGGHRIDALLSRYAGQVRSPKVSRLLSVWRSPDSSTLLIRKNYLADRPEDRLTLELTLSLDRGCLPQSARMFREADGTVVEATVWEYETDGESLVPSRYVHTAFDDEGKLSHGREFQFVGSRVNSPIPEERFDVAAFELEEGDRVVDRVAKRIDRMQNGQLVPVSTAPN